MAWDPLLYRGAGAFVSQLGAELVDLLAPGPREHILDLGCGTGELTRAIADRGATVTGIDADAGMIAQAQRLYPDLAFQVGDGQALTFDGEFEAVFSNAALHWMTRARDVATGVSRALRPGGRFVAEFGGAGNVVIVRETLSAILRDRGLPSAAMPLWYFPTAAAYATVLEEAGLLVHLVHWFERPTCLAGESGLRTWLTLFCGPLLKSLGETADDFVREVEARAHPLLFRDGSWWVDYKRLRIVATRPRAVTPDGRSLLVPVSA